MVHIENFIYFIEIGKSKSISGAANILNMSQPHLSQCLRQLETIVGSQKNY